jgi:cell division protein FtsA
MSKKIITAIDIGSNKVTTVIANLDENENRSTVIGVYTHESIGIKKGVVVNIEDATNSISESINAAERMAGITVSDVFLTINGEQISSINNRGVVAVSGPEITMEDTLRAIENARTLALPENLNPIHIIPREFVVDKQGGIKYPLGMTGTRLEVETHIITAPTSAWLNLRKCVEQLGLNIVDVVFTGWASSLSVLTETEKELGVTLLDIGAGTTSISIFEENAIVFSGCVPLGGINITSDLAIGLQLSLEDAEKVKLNLDKLFAKEQNEEKEKERKKPRLIYKEETKSKDKKGAEDEVDLSTIGISGNKIVSKNLIKQIIEARLEELFELVKDSVSQAGYDVSMPSGIVITGGSGLLRDITKTAQSVFGVSSRVGYPSGLSGMIDEITDPSYSAVQGLIKHALDDEIDVNSNKDEEKNSSTGGILQKFIDWVKSLRP